MKVQVQKVDVLFTRWALCKWTIARILRVQGFVFHRMTAVVQKGSNEPLIHIIPIIPIFHVCHHILYLLIISLWVRTLDVGNNNMTFGGLRKIDSILLHPNHVKTHDFVGCIRNIYVNGILFRPSMALASYNILDR